MVLPTERRLIDSEDYAQFKAEIAGKLSEFTDSNLQRLTSFTQYRQYSNAGTPLVVHSSTIILPTSHHTARNYGAAYYQATSDINDSFLATFPRTTFYTIDETGKKVYWVLSSWGDWDYEAFGAVPYKGTPSITNDCSPAYAEMQALNIWYQGVGSVGYIPGRRVNVGVGKFYHTKPHNSHARWDFRGHGGGTAGGAIPTQLVFAADTHGLIINRHNTNIDQVGGDFSYGASDGTTYRALGIISLGGTNQAIHGVWMRARGNLEDVTIFNFPGNNLNIVANSNLDPSAGGPSGTNLLAGNANFWQLNRVMCQGSGLHGVYIAGIDANAGSSYSVNVLTAGAGGLVDVSYLGNSHYGYEIDHTGLVYNQRCYYNGKVYSLIALTDTGTEPGTNSGIWYDEGEAVAGSAPVWVSNKKYIFAGGVLSTNPNARTVFAGGYLEVGATGRSHVAAPSLVNGGTLQTEFTKSTPMEFIAGGVGGFRSSNVGYGNFAYTVSYGNTYKAAFGDYVYATFSEEMLTVKNGTCVFERVGSALSNDYRRLLLGYNLGILETWANVSSYRRIFGPGTPDKCGRSSPIVRDTMTGTNYNIKNVFYNGILFSDTGRLIQQNVGSPPPGQDYAAGEFSFEADPITNKCMGWSCFTSATLSSPTGTVTDPATWFKSGALFTDASTIAALGNLVPGACSPVITIVVPKATIRDIVKVSAERSLGGVQIVAWVDSPDTVKFYGFNPTGNPQGNIALENRTYFIRVEKM